MALHVLATHHSTTTASCLTSVAKDDYLLLIGDGVYTLQAADLLAQCQTAAKQVLVLEDDLRCRLPNAQVALPMISYSEWVELCIAAGPVVSWY